jgi:hypothetical protein
MMVSRLREIRDLQEQNARLESCVLVLEKFVFELGASVARLDAMHEGVEAPGADHHERKPVLQ